VANRLQIEDCISYVVAKASQQISRRFRDALAGHGVTPVQYAILSVLWERDGLSGSELSSRLAIDSATMTGLIDRMEVIGLVKRSAADGDRRVNRVVLTARGLELEKPLVKVVAQLNKDIADELGGHAPRLWKALRRLGGVSGKKL